MMRRFRLQRRSSAGFLEHPDFEIGGRGSNHSERATSVSFSRCRGNALVRNVLMRLAGLP